MTTITSDVIPVEIIGIGELEGKIDTGAHQSSLHGEDVRVAGDSVIFKINDRIFRADLETSQDISSSDGGTQSRPVISVSMKIEGQVVETLININDRSDMPQQLLIGQDVIRATGLTIELGDGTQEVTDERPSTNPDDHTDAPQAGSDNSTIHLTNAAPSFDASYDPSYGQPTPAYVLSIQRELAEIKQLLQAMSTPISADAE